MAMEAPSSLSSLSAVLRNRLCCFGVGDGGGLAERMRWRRRAGARDFRYDPLSYALNFDEGNHGIDGDDEDRAGGRLVDAFMLSSSQLVTRRPATAVVKRPRRAVWPERRVSLVIDD